MEIKQYAVHWINLDPTVGSEVSKTRPCVILSPDEMNQFLRTIIVAPVTHTLKAYPSRVFCEVKGLQGAIMLDQIRTVDRTRIGSKLDKLSAAEINDVKSIINQMLC